MGHDSTKSAMSAPCGRADAAVGSLDPGAKIPLPDSGPPFLFFIEAGCEHRCRLDAFVPRTGTKLVQLALNVGYVRETRLEPRHLLSNERLLGLELAETRLLSSFRLMVSAPDQASGTDWPACT